MLTTEKIEAIQKEWDQQLDEHGKIPAIKLLKGLTGLGLRETKDMVDRYTLERQEKMFGEMVAHMEKVHRFLESQHRSDEVQEMLRCIENFLD